MSFENPENLYMEKIIYITFGWLLGLLGPIIVSLIQKYYRSKDIKNAIFSELKNLVVRLAASCNIAQSHLGIQDKDTFKWLKDIYEKYRSDCPQDILESMNKMLQTPSELFNVAVNFTKAEENVGISLKKFSVPFIESNMESLSLFESKFQREILEVLALMNHLNEEIETAMFYYKLTFEPSSMQTNKNIISGNMKRSYAQIQRMCKNVAIKVENILKQ